MKEDTENKSISTLSVFLLLSGITGISSISDYFRWNCLRYQLQLLLLLIQQQLPTTVPKTITATPNPLAIIPFCVLQAITGNGQEIYLIE